MVALRNADHNLNGMTVDGQSSVYVDYGKSSWQISLLSPDWTRIAPIQVPIHRLVEQ